jgi:hypothetical protein
LNQSTTVGWDVNIGKPTSIVDPNGKTTVADYTDLLDRLMSVGYPDTGTVQYGYNDAANTVTSTTALSSSLNPCAGPRDPSVRCCLRRPGPQNSDAFVVGSAGDGRNGYGLRCAGPRLPGLESLPIKRCRVHDDELLNCVLRSGHTVEEKTDLLKQLGPLFQELTGIATDQLAISLQEISSSNAMEMGRIMQAVSNE